MQIKAKFDHFNINVLDIEKSAAFYDKALGLTKVRTYTPADGSFTLAYLGDGQSPFMLELTQLKNRKSSPYNLGDNESHICFRVDGDYKKIFQYHKDMGCVCFENTQMGLYFIEDPDGYWIEILPKK